MHACEDPFFFTKRIITVAWRLVISQHQPNTSHNIYIIYQRGFDSYTTPPQQLHNTLSHGSGSHTLDSTPCERVLCNCCGGIVNLSIFNLKCRRNCGCPINTSLYIKGEWVSRRQYGEQQRQPPDVEEREGGLMSWMWCHYRTDRL